MERPLLCLKSIHLLKDVSRWMGTKDGSVQFSPFHLNIWPDKELKEKSQKNICAGWISNGGPTQLLIVLSISVSEKRHFLKQLAMSKILKGEGKTLLCIFKAFSSFMSPSCCDSICIFCTRATVFKWPITSPAGHLRLKRETRLGAWANWPLMGNCLL